MKKFVLAAALAVVAAAALTQQASAWCKFCFNSGCNITLEHGGGHCLSFSCSSQDCCPTCCDGCCGPACGGYPADWFPHAAPAPVAHAAPPAVAPTGPVLPAPTFPPTPKPADPPKTGNQPVSYTNYGYGYVPASPSSGYMFYPQSGYGGAPSYWYGR